MRYNWLLFDADGTLFDYDAAEARHSLATYERATSNITPIIWKPIAGSTRKCGSNSNVGR